MKQQLLLIVLCLCALGSLWAQTGEAYIGTRKVQEKDYSIKQLHGQNVLTLETVTTGFYDNKGNIVEEIIMQGNMTYKGKTFIKIDQDPWYKETLNYNHMNLLSLRKVELVTSEDKEKIYLEYDNKGKLLKKIETKIFTQTGDGWEFVYNQVGYVPQYSQIIKDSTHKIMENRVFNYSDDHIKSYYYAYNKDSLLEKMVEISATDTLLSKSIYEYDEAGNLLKESLYDQDEQLVEFTAYAYDEKNRLLQSSYTEYSPRFGRTPNLRRQKDYIYD
ncbi:MAG: hypothetical protein LHW64_00805 [Candidatus Cloacimonetes bacterium]|jgi:hypothetical protein|nr:hypothetical protein [Candidatus Cloacimonadota bacterium]MCB5286327.1 hypothetical protein [Candidatus Cloacimonadota bacterium]MCK9184026.1 hypothetical protein [Candidatus Cloacimonadota bacterium]MCK9583726.1 hypothetical protein [Candidatus Cloacimonadota bacterium]MDY0228649.1 hypothetical protein [Candidatus Cloacimonadaceae bacterium]